MALEGLLALNVACNILQLLRFGSEAIHLLNQIYSKPSGNSVAEVDIHASCIRSAVTTLQMSVGKLPDQGLMDQNSIDLDDISQKCLGAAEELQQCIANMPRPIKKRNIFTVLLWILRTKGDMDKIKKRLDMYQHDLDTRILVNLSFKLDAMHLQTHDLVDLPKALKDLIEELRVKQGHESGTAVHLEMESTGNVVEVESINVAMAATNKSEGLQLQRHHYNKCHYQSERFLTSLEYPSMGARRHQIPAPQTRTFEWLFSSNSRQTENTEGFICQWDPLDAWLATGSGIYWINGKAGSGKSTLLKYIVNSAQTISALGEWSNSHEIVILSHYFWTAGNIHERSAKGFFQSLLRQMLLQIPEVLRDILSEDQGARFAQKKNHDDWSEEELVTTIEKVEQTSKRRFCYFVDGLDELEEASSDIHCPVLKFLRSRAETDVAKCCVSSRPVPKYEAAFAKSPQMRLQDLTEPDIREVIDQHFQLMSPAVVQLVDLTAMRDIRNEIMCKANGVFLWVSLVLRSLIRGRENGDDLPTLQRRLASLPSDLEKLYERTWKQLNDDESIYRSEAAFIFRLVLHREDFWMVNTDEHNSYCRSLLFFTMVINGVDIRSALPEFREAAVKRIEAQCVMMINMIRSRCAGMLEVIGPGQTKEPSLANGNLFHDRLRRYVTLEVRFIHRSAHAFLAETRFGQSILSHCPLSRIDIATRIVQSALLFWHTKITSQGELPYTLHLAERFMIQHAKTKEERDLLSRAISASLDMYKRLSNWSMTEQDGSYLLYQYIDPAMRYHTVDTAGWMLSFATEQIFKEAYHRENNKLNPAFTDYLLLCLASQIHFRVPNPRFHEQEDYLRFLLSHQPRLDTIYYLRYPYPFKKSAALLLTEKFVYDLLNNDHTAEPYELLRSFFDEAAHLGWDLSAKFVVLWSLEDIYRSLLMPIERLFVPGSQYSTTAVMEVNLCYLLEFVLMFSGTHSSRTVLTRTVGHLINVSSHIEPEMEILLLSKGGARSPDGFRSEQQQLDDIRKRGWVSLPAQEAAQLKAVYEQYQQSRPEAQSRGRFGRQHIPLSNSTNLFDAIDECTEKGNPENFFEFLEVRKYCANPTNPAVMHKAPKPFVEEVLPEN